MRIRFIGDVHAKYDQYKEISTAKDIDYSIQVGDFGVGFEDLPLLEHNELFIRGNHDNPQLCFANPNNITDGSLFYLKNTLLFFLGGADSIDKQWRVPGVSWWADEECSYEQLDILKDLYNRNKPSIVATHDCPESIIQYMHWYDRRGLHYTSSRTRMALQDMLDLHKPKLWIFGHHHQSIDVNVDGTRFICLNELEYIDIDLD